MIRDAVGAGGVIVYETEVVGCACEDLGDFAEFIEALGDRPRLAASITLGGVNRLIGLCIDQRTIRQKSRCLIDAEYGGTSTNRFSIEPALSNQLIYYRGVLICVSVGPRLIVYWTL